MTSSATFRHDITGMRALAVLSVITFHFEKTLLPGGFLGVDVFFVISGYVITLSLLGYRPMMPLGGMLREFYLRRLKRLVPALVLLGLVAGTAICLVDPEPYASLKTGMAGMLGLSNMYLWLSATEYFATSTDFNVFTHTWSLGVEEQFYLLYPVLVWALINRRKEGRRGFVAVMLVAAILSLGLFLWWSRMAPAWAFYLMPARFWELAAGGLLCLVPRRQGGPQIIPVLALLGMLAAFVLPETESAWSTPLVVLSTVLLIATNRQGAPVDRLLRAAPMIWIGEISYSLYLWHWPVLAISRWTIGITWITAPLLLALMFGMAALSYYGVEAPLRRRSWRIGRVGPIGWGVATVCAACLALGALWQAGGYRTLYMGDPSIRRQGTDSAWLQANAVVAGRAEALRQDCNMTPHHLTGASYRPQPDLDQAFFDRCLQPEGEGRKILLAGDSFASRTAQPLSVLAEAQGDRFGMVFGYGCPYPLSFADIPGSLVPQCPNLDVEAMRTALLAALDPGDILVLRLYLPNEAYLKFPTGHLPDTGAYDRALAGLAQDVVARGAGLLVIGANATLGVAEQQSLAPQWFQKALYQEWVEPQGTPETAYHHALDAHLAELIPNLDPASSEGLRYMSLSRYFCDVEGACRIRSGEDVYYIDEAHLSERGYDLFRNDLSDVLREMQQVLPAAK